MTLGTEERAVLESWVRAVSTEQRMALRARIVLRAAAGESTAAIARGLAVRAATVSKWRTRFVRQRLAGLHDAPRPGKPGPLHAGDGASCAGDAGPATGHGVRQLER